jgi:hypothetical protein
MRMISKITSEKLQLTKGKTYVFEKTPKMIDPITFEEVIGYQEKYIRNDSGFLIKVNGKYNPKWPFALYLDHFTTLSELRDKKLNDLGI